MDGNFRVVLEGLKTRKLNVLQEVDTFGCEGLIVYLAESQFCAARTENKALWFLYTYMPLIFSVAFMYVKMPSNNFFHSSVNMMSHGRVSFLFCNQLLRITVAYIHLLI